MAVSFKPAGSPSVIPYLTVRDTPKAIEFYKQAFGATEVCKHLMPDGKTIMHAEVKIGDSVVYLSEENPQWGCFSPLALDKPSPVTVHMYVPDVDATFARATEFGATTTMPPMDAFWGDRFGKLTDPFGHQWSIATHLKDLTEAEIAAGAKEFFAQMESAGAPA